MIISRMLKKSYSHPPSLTRRRRPSHALFSPRSEAQRTSEVRIRLIARCGLAEGLFEHPVQQRND